VEIARIYANFGVLRRFAEYIHVLTPVSLISIVFGRFRTNNWPETMKLEGMLLTRSWLVYTTKEVVMITVVNRHSYTGKGVYIGRGTALGNKFSHAGYKGTIKVPSRQQSVERYARWLKKQLNMPQSPACVMFLKLAQQAWAGKDVTLICSCAPKACHGDVIKQAIENLLEEVKS